MWTDVERRLDANPEPIRAFATARGLQNRDASLREGRFDVERIEQEVGHGLMLATCAG